MIVQWSFLISCLSHILYLQIYLDYEKVLELEPNNFEATNELRKINQVKHSYLSALLNVYLMK